jgi:PAS domain S-box-containing protein
VVASLKAESDRIFASGKPITVEETMFDAGRGGLTTFLSNKTPLYAADGRALGILGVSRDITDRKRMEDELRASERQLAQQVAELNALYSSAPIGLGFFSRDYRYLRINQELAEINGVAVEDHIGRTIREVLPGNAPQVEPVIDEIFRIGKPVGSFEVSGETPQQPGVVRHWLAGFYPVFGDNHQVSSVGAWVVEITERKAAEERETLLAREVDHRAKNLLAVVQSVIQLTRADTAQELKDAVVGRIQALASAHALLADSRWEGVELQQLAAEEMAPFSGGAVQRARFSGPPVRLRPAAAQSLAMILHELATNAVKYGALSSSSGQLEIGWSIVPASQTVVLKWVERGGPPSREPEVLGFGSRIIRTTIERQLRGRLIKEWRREGLHCTVEFPLDQTAGADV